MHKYNSAQRGNLKKNYILFPGTIYYFGCRKISDDLNKYNVIFAFMHLYNCTDKISVYFHSILLSHFYYRRHYHNLLCVQYSLDGHRCFDTDEARARYFGICVHAKFKWSEK